MRLRHKDKDGRGEIHFIKGESQINDSFENPKSQYLTIALNAGEDQKITIDGISYNFPSWTIISLIAYQSFSFEDTQNIHFWRYNREFYCMADNHVEISCIGLIFLGYSKNLFLELNHQEQMKIATLSQLFIEEFESEDYIKTDMLLALLKRFIIILTRLAKQQHFKDEALTDDKFDLIRQFNFHVEGHFKKEHKVQFYADLMNKSPKTLSNIFSLYNYNSPMSIIHDRVISEAKRLLYYSNKSAKEIAFELGFDDAAHFSRFFKNATHQNTSSFRKSLVIEA